VKVALVAPAATVTEGGTVTAALPLETDTTTLLEEAFVRVKVHVEFAPALRVLGEHTRELSTT
jgi:hypothetical protein